MWDNAVLGHGLIVFSGFVIFVFACREVVSCYLRNNKKIILLEKIEDSVRKEHPGAEMTVDKTIDKSIDKTMYDTIKSIDKQLKI